MEFVVEPDTDDVVDGVEAVPHAYGLPGACFESMGHVWFRS